MSDPIDPTTTSTAEIAAAIRNGETTSEAVVTACLDRINAVNDRVNAVVTLVADAALDAARAADAAQARGESLGPLHGVPMTIKDSLDTAGVISTWGLPPLAGRVPEEDATVVARLKAAGAILLGKTNTSELTLSFQASNPLFGLTTNPYNPERIAGGSSGGAAAIVALGGAPFDIGTDTGGSVRLPAHYCGIAGLRPTSGRVPRTGHAIPYGGLLDALTTVGPLARRVADLALLLSVIAGPDGRDYAIAPVPLRDAADVDLAGLRCAFFIDNGIQSPTAETAEAVLAAAKTLVDAGVEVAEVRPPVVPETYDVFRSVMRSGTNTPWIHTLLERAGADRMQTKFRTYNEVPSLEVVTRAVDRWDSFRREMLTFMQPYDLLLSPTNADVALPPDSIEENLPNFSYTFTHNLTGWPAAVVRGGTSQDGLPIGVQIAAPPWREDLALAAASCIEAATGGWQPA